VLRVLERARCSKYRSILVFHRIISICRPIGGLIKQSTYTYYTSPLFKTLSTEFELQISSSGGWQATELIVSCLFVTTLILFQI